jgi:hypothetical protein
MQIWNRLFKGPTRGEISTVFELCDTVQNLVDLKYVRVEEHEARVRELIDANTRRLEEARQHKREAETLERELMRAVRKAHENTGLALAVDWMTRFAPAHSTCLDLLASFVAGFTGGPVTKGGQHAIAHQDGAKARHAHDKTVSEATKAAGLAAI